ncbi:hypothetical protein BU17DRAFT_80191 [Hysterangium stoloniferum]|nr:hypothetical protein BU17DRAFT_80191 [Hysterangium stoloniferum]
MAGKKGTSATKPPSKTAGLPRQANLLQFYKKRSELTVGNVTAGKGDPQQQPPSQFQHELQNSPSELSSTQHKRGGSFIEESQRQVRLEITDQTAEPIPEAFHKSNEGNVVTHLVENGECGSPRSKKLETRNAATTSQNSIPNFRLDAEGGEPSFLQNLPPVMTPMKTVTGGPTPTVIDLTSSPIVNHRAANDTNNFTTKSFIVVPDDTDPSSFPLLGSENVPIELSSSPSLEISHSKTIHPFFARSFKGPAKSIPSHTTSPINTAAKSLESIWPDAICQHTTGPQSSFWTSTSFLPFGKRRPCSAPSLTIQPLSLGFLKVPSSAQSASQDRILPTKCQIPTSADRGSAISSLPDEHRNHPGISRLLNISQSAGSSVQSEMWSHKWRPRNASEVLGNEDNAVYLKTWLHTLALRGGTSHTAFVNSADVDCALPRTKGPNVVRVVDKRRKRRRLQSTDDSDVDQWIADDNDDDEVMGSSGSESRENVPRDGILPRRAGTDSPHKSSKRNLELGAGPPENFRPPDFSTLTNTILLEGPPGSGKTSTIYACAEELGWEVFEVYPGIGKRSGVSLSSLIGDVGTNHLVGGRKTGTHTKHNTRANQGNHDVTVNHEDQTILQSIIVLEEVDILFKDDTSFWSTVVNIIKHSHRPVILTCNDASLLPQDDLPLQTCLHFRSCPTPLAVSFLQCVCLAEDRLVSRKQLEILYTENSYTLMSSDESDEPLLPFPSQVPPCPDIRRSLNYLQFWCIRNLVAVEEEYNTGLAPTLDSSRNEIIADWSQLLNKYDGSSPATDGTYNSHWLQRQSECASYVDAYLERRPWDVEEALAIDRYEPSADDEVGHLLLCKFRATERSRGLAFYNRETDMAYEALYGSHHVFETAVGPHVKANLSERGTTRLLDSRLLRRRRMANQVRIVSFLDDVISRFSPLLPRPAAVLDYTPYVRQMIIADDVMEAAARAKLEASQSAIDVQGRRRRRRRAAEEYIRHLAVSEGGQEAAREFCWV